MFQVSGSESTSTGIPPALITADAHEIIVNEGMITSSPFFILLATGGHGFEVLEEIEMIEVKQGPYAGDEDKTLSLIHI